MPTPDAGRRNDMTGTVCMPCWLAYDPDKHAAVKDHEPRKCRVRWVEKGQTTVCMCGCARKTPSRQADTP